MLKRWIITIAACLAVFAGLASFKFFEIKDAIAKGKAYPEPSETVYAYTTKSHDFQDKHQLIGEITAPHSLNLSNELSGTISAVNFHSGEQVEAGKILLELDTREEKARLQAAKANAELARLTLQRNKKLRSSNRVSAEAYDQASAQYQTALADIAQLEVVISKKTIRAPFAASTGIQNLEVGQFLQSNSTITHLIGLDNFVWVDFNLSQSEHDLQLGDQVQVNSLLNIGISFAAVIVARDSAVSSVSRQLKYRARLEQSTEQFKPQSIVSVKVNKGEQQQVTQIPDSALTQDQFGQYVFILEPEAKGEYRAKRQAVKLGPKLDSRVTVLSGLAPGQLIASTGAFKLRPGLKVYIHTPATVSQEQ